MSNLLFGILTVSVCSIGYYYSWKYQARNNFKIALLLILVCGLILRVYTSTDFFLHNWDERYHALVAKNLIQHPLTPTLYDNVVLPYNYDNWVANHVWLEKGPIPLWAIAISIKIFGNTDMAVRIPSIILSLLAVYLTFLIGTLLFNKKVGLLASFFHSINGLVIEVAAGRVSSDHVETFFIFLIELGVFISIVAIIKNKNKKFSLLIGAATGLAFLCKWSPALIVFPLWVMGEILVANKSKSQIFTHLLVAIFAFCIVVAPWLWHIRVAFPQESAWIIKKFLFAYNETLEQHQGLFYYYFQNMGMVFGEIIWIPLLISFFQIVKKQADWRMNMLSMWWIIPFTIFSFAATKRHTYLLLAAPAIFIILSHYWFYLNGLHVQKKWLINIILALLILLPIRYSFERVKPFLNLERNPEWAQDLKNMNGKYAANTLFFNYKHAIEGMYYTDYIFYTQVPDQEIIEKLQKQGYRIYISDNVNIPAEIRDINGVMIEK